MEKVTVECFRCQGTGLFSTNRDCYTCGGDGELDLDRVVYLRDRLVPDQLERYEATGHRFGFSPRQAEYQLEKLAEAYDQLQKLQRSDAKGKLRKCVERKKVLEKIKTIERMLVEVKAELVG